MMANEHNCPNNVNDDNHQYKLLVDFNAGFPGKSRLTKCREMLLQATQSVMKADCDVVDILCYGFEGGDDAFRNQLAQLLSSEYGDNVHKECLMMTSGATQGLHMALTLLISAFSPIFVIDPTYFFAQAFIEKELTNPLIAVPSDGHGPLMQELEDLVKLHLSTEKSVTESAQQLSSHLTCNQPYRGAVYLVPTFNNPTGSSFSPDKCRQLISLARKYNLLLVADDVYNLLYFTKSSPQDVPRRLLAYDLPTDPDYGKGHVLSNGTFSKILAPGLRLGWIEGPKDIIRNMAYSNLSLSGGAFNHYIGKLVAQIIQSGQQQQHLRWLRHQYRSARDALCDVLDQDLPSDIKYLRPEGGYFVWVPLRQDVDGEDFLAFCERENYNLKFLPGVRTSPSKKFKNCVRLSLANIELDDMTSGGKRFCQAYTDYLKSTTKS